MTFARNESPGALRRVPTGLSSATLNVLIAGTSYTGAGAAARGGAGAAASGDDTTGGAFAAQPVAAAAQRIVANRRIVRRTRSTLADAAFTLLQCSAPPRRASPVARSFARFVSGYIYP